MTRVTLCLFLLLVLPAAMPAQEPIVIRLDAEAKTGPLKPIWSYFGYDEPNYTYMKNGAKLINELSTSNPVPVHIRVHNLLTTGDGEPALKWGSTNAYTEDAAGRPVYDWTIVDKIFDTFIKAGARPFVEIGFMPEAMSIKPEPYRHHWHVGAKYEEIYTGWAYPPKDYTKWAELVRQWVAHCVKRYGQREVLSWYWELWNEPNIGYWRGTPDEYNKLYDYTAEAVKGVLPNARIGGPASTGPANAQAAAFLKQFLEHCVSGKNYATGKTGAPLDFITFHAKGRPNVIDGHVQMGLRENLQDVAQGFQIVGQYPSLRKLPIILSESDPEGCAACSARAYPPNAYRNGPLYPAYTAVAISQITKLAEKYQANIEGMQTWAFEFENQPWFDGFRTLATNGVDKPVLNVFRMAGMMRGNRLRVESSGGIELDELLKSGVRTPRPYIDAFAARTDHELSVMVWNYHDDDVSAPDSPLRLILDHLPAMTGRIMMQHYRIDQNHSNAYTVWQKMGSPQNPSAEQYAQLERAGQLELLESPQWIFSQSGKVELNFVMPRQSVSLIHLSW